MWSDVGVQRNRPYLFTDALFRGIPNWYIRGAMQPDHWAAVAQAGIGTCQVTNPSGYIWDSGEIAHGTMPVAIAALPTGDYQVTWMTTIAPAGSIAHRVNLSPALVPLTSVWAVPTTAIYGSSDGFLDSFADQPPICTQTVSPRVFAGYTLWLWTQRGPWVIGQTDQFYGVLGINVDTGMAYVVARGNSQTPSHLALMEDGTPVAVAAQTDVLIPFSAWTVWSGPTPPDPPIPPVPPDPPIPPIPPRPPVAFPLELLMSSSEGAFVVDKKRLVLNTKADLDPADPGAGVFLGPHCYHMRHPDGGYVSIGPDAQGNWTVAPTGAKYVSSRENFQWDGQSNSCLINCGPPTQVRGFSVMNPT